MASQPWLLEAISEGNTSPDYKLPSTTSPELVEAVSQRELDVLQLLVTGKSNQEIADELFLALGTVKTHLNRLYAKLDVHTRTQAIARARDLDLLR